MSLDSPFDGQAELASAEQASIVRMIRDGDIDTTKVYNLPAYDRNKEGTHVQFWCPRWLITALDELTGRGEKFRDRSQALRQAMLYFLKVEALTAGVPTRVDTVLIQADLEDEISQMASLDEDIKLVEKLMKEADGDPQFQRAKAQAVKLTELCEKNGHFNRMVDIARMVDTVESLRAHDVYPRR